MLKKSGGKQSVRKMRVNKIGVKISWGKKTGTKSRGKKWGKKVEVKNIFFSNCKIAEKKSRFVGHF